MSKCQFSIGIMSCCLLVHGGVVVFVVVGDFWGDFVGWWGFNVVCAVWQHQAKQTCALDPLSPTGNCAEGATFY